MLKRRAEPPRLGNLSGPVLQWSWPDRPDRGPQTGTQSPDVWGQVVSLKAQAGLISLVPGSRLWSTEGRMWRCHPQGLPWPGATVSLCSASRTVSSWPGVFGTRALLRPRWFQILLRHLSHASLLWPGPPSFPTYTPPSSVGFPPLFSSLPHLTPGSAPLSSVGPLDPESQSLGDPPKGGPVTLACSC